MKYDIPEVGVYEIKTIVLDLNGTLSVKGKISEGTRRNIQKIRKLGIEVVLFTGDQRGTVKTLCEDLGISYKVASSGAEKEELFLELDIETTAAIGNARIDNGTFKHAKIAIATLHQEGIHTGILKYVDVLIPSIEDALDMFIDPNILCATMRK